MIFIKIIINKTGSTGYCMGNCVSEFNRHLTTRENFGVSTDPAELLERRQRSSIESIVGANADVTSAIEAHRQALREGGIVQPPAPTETLKSIHCPVNLKKESI